MTVKETSLSETFKVIRDNCFKNIFEGSVTSSRIQMCNDGMCCLKVTLLSPLLIHLAL